MIDLTPFTSRPDAAAVVTDFDGTLSAIVDDPATARPVPGAVELLGALVRTYRRVAVVSGRPVAFLARHVQVEGVVLVGLYGLERIDGGDTWVHPEANAWVRAVADMAARAEADAPAEVGIERKGLSFTIHVRGAPEHLEWARSFADSVAGVTGLVPHAGRMSIELRPPVDVDKGTVVAQLVDGAGAVVFAGDDAGDLPAFDVLDRLRADHGTATVKVGVRSAEAPAELIERADVLVDGPEGAVAFLGQLAAAT